MINLSLSEQDIERLLEVVAQAMYYLNCEIGQTLSLANPDRLAALQAKLTEAVNFHRAFIAILSNEEQQKGEVSK